MLNASFLLDNSYLHAVFMETGLHFILLFNMKTVFMLHKNR